MKSVSSWWSRHWRESAPTEVNFLIFAPTWSIVALAALTVIPLKFSHMLSSKMAQIGVLVLEGLTMVYWFGGFIALAVFLGDRICFGKVCDVARASAAISGISWAVWAVTFGFGVFQLIKGGSGWSFGRKQPDMGNGKVQMHQGV
jgi:hypothetical protein